MLDYDLKKTLEWCVENGVVFRITNSGGLLAVTAQLERVFAEYPVEEPLDAARLGNATWAALFSVKHGTDLHREHGQLPPIEAASP